MGVSSDVFANKLSVVGFEWLNEKIGDYFYLNQKK